MSEHYSNKVRWRQKRKKGENLQGVHQRLYEEKSISCGDFHEVLCRSSNFTCITSYQSFYWQEALLELCFWFEKKKSFKEHNLRLFLAEKENEDFPTSWIYDSLITLRQACNQNRDDLRELVQQEYRLYSRWLVKEGIPMIYGNFFHWKFM